MAAVDGYRAASMLKPALLELVEWLKNVGSPSAQKYLDGQELNVILRLYEQVLQSPGTRFTLDHIHKVSMFRWVFCKSLLKLFKDHIDCESMDLNNLQVAVRSSQRGGP